MHIIHKKKQNSLPHGLSGILDKISKANLLWLGPPITMMFLEAAIEIEFVLKIIN